MSVVIHLFNTHSTNLVSTVFTSISFVVWWPGFESLLCHLLPVGPWVKWMTLSESQIAHLWNKGTSRTSHRAVVRDDQIIPQVCSASCLTHGEYSGLICGKCLHLLPEVNNPASGFTPAQEATWSDLLVQIRNPRACSGKAPTHLPSLSPCHQELLSGAFSAWGSPHPPLSVPQILGSQIGKLWL